MKPVGLQARVTALVALGALALSASVAVATYDVTRQQLLDERQRTAVRAAYFDAAVVQAGLLTRGTSPIDVLRALDTGTNRRPVILRGRQWYARTPDSGITDAVPSDVQRVAESGKAARQRVEVAGHPTLVTAIPLPAVGVTYYELNDLSELQRTLRVLALVLLLVALATAAAAAVLGYWAGRRALRPLRSVARTAASIAGGDLTARLDPGHEPDVARLATSFNTMVDELQRRLERDRRFAADVSHELRSPLQTLSAATSVLAKAQHGDAPPTQRERAALRLVTEEVDRFTQLVTDLIELARADRAVERDTLDLQQLLADACAPRGVPVDPGPPLLLSADRRRLSQTLANLLDNAQRYGGGAVAVRAVRSHRCVRVEVDDAGPGVAPAERDLIFDRFARGRAASARGASDGTGLGLALVAEHASAHGGRAYVTERPGGGARMVVELPA